MGKLARPERFELPTSWFVGSSKPTQPDAATRNLMIFWGVSLTPFGCVWLVPRRVVARW